MSYIQPTGIIELFNGINLDNRYIHTIYFENTDAQTRFFNSKVTTELTFNAQTYTRPTKQSIRLKVNNEVVQSCSYLRFNNRGNKWYYAFVLGTNYVNENVTDIFYEIDVMQSWFIQNGHLLPCFIERQHVINDNFSAHLEIEPVGSDVYDIDEIKNDYADELFASYTAIQFFSNKGDGFGAKEIDGMFTGGTIKYAHNADVFGANIINSLGSWDKNEQSADVIDMFMYPRNFLKDTTSGNIIDDVGTKRITINLPDSYDAYIPQNNKLFTYPFSYLIVTSNDGDSGIFRWEFFDNVLLGSEIEFDLNSCRLGGGQIEIHPRSYNGVEDNFDNKIVIDNFPKLAFTYDAFQAWLAAGGKTKLEKEKYFIEKKGALANEKNILSEVIGLSSSLGQIGAGIALAATGPGAPVGAGLIASGAMQGATTIANTFSSQQSIKTELEEARNKLAFEFKDKKYEPDITVGKSASSIAISKHYLGFRFLHCHVRDSEAKRIDNFLTMYGYSINDVAVPNYQVDLIGILLKQKIVR